MEIIQMLLTPSQFTRPQTKITPTKLAWHYVGNPNTSAINNRNYFESLSKSGNTYASSHFIIGLEGEILQLIPESEISYCTNWANNYTISIECCHPDSTGKFTEATYKSMVWLGRYLMEKWNITENIRHYDITKKICPKWFVDHPEDWEKFKQDLKGEDDEMLQELVDQYGESEVRQALQTLIKQQKESNRFINITSVPEWAYPTVKKLIDKEILAGTGNSLDLSFDLTRMLVILDRLGLIK